MNSYDIGSLVQLTATFVNANGVATDPTTVSCTVRDPAGNITTPTAARDATGVWNADLDLTSAMAGVWWYRFVGSGACQAAAEAQLYVRESQI